jgi:hypothetical protein
MMIALAEQSEQRNAIVNEETKKQKNKKCRHIRLQAMLVRPCSPWVSFPLHLISSLLFLLIFCAVLL